MAIQQIDVDGQQLGYTESGGSGRPVVFVHGNSSSHRTWRALLDGPFGKQFHALAFDLPGHGGSAPAATYSLAAYAAVLRGFLRAKNVEDAVVVGWSLGGHIVLEAAPELPDAAGYAIFGTPPVASPADVASGFQPNPAMNSAFSADIDAFGARAFATAFLAPGSDYAVDEIVADILATDGTARTAIGAGIAAGEFRDEAEIVAKLRCPLAILHGEREQLISLDYLRQVKAPTLWRGEVQVLPGAGHAPQLETPEAFAAKLTEFLADVG